MRDWVNLIADKQLFIRKHYTPGRRNRLRAIVLHHNAGTLTTEGCYWAWQTRKASAHYQVEVDGTIGQLVHDRDTAWHAGNANSYTIGIEHANNRLAPAWTISDATLENGAHLVAALCRAYGLGMPTWGVNVYPHQHFMNTGCPGAIAGVQRDRYMSRARAWYEAMGNGNSTPGTAPVITTMKGENMLMRETDGTIYEVSGGRRTHVGNLDLVQRMVNAGIPLIQVKDGDTGWWAGSDDEAKAPARVREIKDILTGFPGMGETLKQTSVLGKIAEKLGIPPRTN
ncbi:N-acetylmuramoyl-L-alanine amidase [Mobiluncus curtisii]|uniref:N-acetylmuramoyl-L-alanine amidase n=1 Tax=Mobiluncus curtisii ATCC 51333 TaxID=887326 RepID=E6M113_9ACTO|nr:peptidoglycan recognition family protein [Mobiluncus curtisii]EFU79643.1 N-acetylmuramoyl-L-alanine amidase A [Mobiluncus curtisii ATCC 51333]